MPTAEVDWMILIGSVLRAVSDQRCLVTRSGRAPVAGVDSGVSGNEMVWLPINRMNAYLPLIGRRGSRIRFSSSSGKPVGKAGGAGVPVRQNG